MRVSPGFFPLFLAAGRRDLKPKRVRRGWKK